MTDRRAREISRRDFVAMTLTASACCLGPGTKNCRLMSN
ncbi:MAG: twin-arginine translocation signal domain-containing protein [Thermodesulfobacteriota bacterium]